MAKAANMYVLICCLGMAFAGLERVRRTHWLGRFLPILDIHLACASRLGITSVGNIYDVPAFVGQLSWDRPRWTLL